MSTDGPRSLREVAQAALDNNPGTSGRELDRQAKKKGLSIVYTTINAMAAGTYNSRPSRKTLEALSDLSGFTIEEVYQAARLPLPLKPLRDDLPPDADLLDGTQRRIVIDAIRSFAQQNRRLAELDAELKELMGNAEHPAAKTEPGESPALPTQPIALKLLAEVDWDPHQALPLLAHEKDTPEAHLAADEIRALLELDPQRLLAARKALRERHFPQGPREQGGD